MIEDTKKIKVILFDIDDTLFDREKAIVRVIIRIVEKLPDLFKGIKKEKVIKSFRKADRMGLEAFNSGLTGIDVRNRRSRWFLEDLGLDVSFADEITRLYVESYPCVSAAVPGAKQVVEKLNKRFPLGVISNGFPDIQYNKLKSLHIEKLFKVILLSEELGMRKPDKRIFKLAAERLRIKVECCLFVGDSLDTDILGAKSSGMKACWFNRNGTQNNNTEIKPDFEIHSLLELLPLSFSQNRASC